MTDPERSAMQAEAGTTAPPPAEPAPSAGRLLRRAREARGLHIAAFAATLKIPQRKVEALEADRYDDLPDPAFTRALAKSACRALKIDPAPVLALLPRPDAGMLDQVSAGLNTPFREGRASTLESAQWLRSPAMWVVVALALGAALIAFWPAPTPEIVPVTVTTPADVATPPMPPASVTDAPQPGAQVAATPQVAVDAAAPVAVAPAPAPPPAPAPASAPSAAVTAAAAAPLVSVTARAESWVQIVDGAGRTRVERELRAGEAITVDGPLPMQVTVGNAGATDVKLRGVAVDLAAATRGNVARVELR